MSDFEIDTESGGIVGVLWGLFFTALICGLIYGCFCLGLGLGIESGIQIAEAVQ